jgi:uncharacterized protein (DUF1330 family)
MHCSSSALLETIAPHTNRADAHAAKARTRKHRCTMMPCTLSWHHRGHLHTTAGAYAMATYIVFTKESTQDQGELDLYQSKVGETFKGHPVKILAAYGPQQVLEGDAPEGVVIVEFPSTAAARAWYDGPAYQEVAQHRFKGAKYRAVLVEGV